MPRLKGGDLCFQPEQAAHLPHGAQQLSALSIDAAEDRRRRRSLALHYLFNCELERRVLTPGTIPELNQVSQERERERSTMEHANVQHSQSAIDRHSASHWPSEACRLGGRQSEFDGQMSNLA